MIADASGAERPKKFLQYHLLIGGTGISKTLFLLPGRVTHLTPFSHAESDVYLVTLGGAGLIRHADEQALRLRASNAKRYTAVKDLNSPLPTVALCPSLEFASHIASKARCAKLTFTSRALITQFIDVFMEVKLLRPSVVVDELTGLPPCCRRHSKFSNRYAQ